MSNTQLAERPKQSALSTMAARFNVEPASLLSTLKDTAFKGATDAQMMALCVVANEYGLNPFTKEIYAFPDKKSGGIIPVIGVDGWYRIVNEHPQFNGVEIAIEWAGQTPVSATCKMFRKDRDHPTVLTEYLAECKRNTDPWNTQPVRMLRHRAFIQCARVTFGLACSDPEDAARMEAAAKRDELAATRNPFEKQAVVEVIETEVITEPEPSPEPAAYTSLDAIKSFLAHDKISVKDALGALATLGIHDGKTPFTKMDDATLDRIAADWQTVKEIVAQLESVKS